MKKNNDTNDGFEPILPTSNEEEMKRMMKELDREQSYREHKCWRQYITVVISVIFVVFQLYATLSGSIPAQILRASHLAFVQYRITFHIQIFYFLLLQDFLFLDI